MFATNEKKRAKNYKLLYLIILQNNMLIIYSLALLNYYLKVKFLSIKNLI